MSTASESKRIVEKKNINTVNMLSEEYSPINYEYLDNDCVIHILSYLNAKDKQILVERKQNNHLIGYCKEIRNGRVADFFQTFEFCKTDVNVGFMLNLLRLTEKDLTFCVENLEEFEYLFGGNLFQSQFSTNKSRTIKVNTNLQTYKLIDKLALPSNIIVTAIVRSVDIADFSDWLSTETHIKNTIHVELVLTCSPYLNNVINNLINLATSNKINITLKKLYLCGNIFQSNNRSRNKTKKLHLSNSILQYSYNRYSNLKTGLTLQFPSLQVVGAMRLHIKNICTMKDIDDRICLDTAHIFLDDDYHYTYQWSGADFHKFENLETFEIAYMPGAYPLKFYESLNNTSLKLFKYKSEANMTQIFEKNNFPSNFSFQVDTILSDIIVIFQDESEIVDKINCDKYISDLKYYFGQNYNLVDTAFVGFINVAKVINDEFVFTEKDYFDQNFEAQISLHSHVVDTQIYYLRKIFTQYEFFTSVRNGDFEQIEYRTYVTSKNYRLDFIPDSQPEF